MFVLVIPDVHLKPWMFQKADNLLRHGVADRAVCLMDLPDDWDKENDIDLYAQTFDAAMEFARKHPKTRWCYGNHDLSYWWNRLESGYSSFAAHTAGRKLLEFRRMMPEDNPIAYVHRIDNVLFSHGGVADYFVKEYVSKSKYDDADAVLEIINGLGESEMWADESPIWLRPQSGNTRMYKPRKLLQVVGHTPVKEISKKGNIISCDVFSTDSAGKPYGTQEFLLLDTVTWGFTGFTG